MRVEFVCVCGGGGVGGGSSILTKLLCCIVGELKVYRGATESSKLIYTTEDIVIYAGAAEVHILPHF